jgi:hypothetical protein
MNFATPGAASRPAAVTVAACLMFGMAALGCITATLAALMTLSFATVEQAGVNPADTVWPRASLYFVVAGGLAAVVVLVPLAVLNLRSSYWARAVTYVAISLGLPCCLCSAANLYQIYTESYDVIDQAAIGTGAATAHYQIFSGPFVPLVDTIYGAAVALSVTILVLLSLARSRAYFEPPPSHLAPQTARVQ